MEFLSLIMTIRNIQNTQKSSLLRTQCPLRGHPIYESSSSQVDLKLFLALIITIAISSVIFVKLTGNSHIHTYWVQGAYGSLFGIIAGPPGIAAANSKRLSRTKCLWTSHIVLVSKFNFFCAKYQGLPLDFKLIKYFRVLSQRLYFGNVFLCDFII